jgi:hypothetical protein
LGQPYGEQSEWHQNVFKMDYYKAIQGGKWIIDSVFWSKIIDENLHKKKIH